VARLELSLHVQAPGAFARFDHDHYFDAVDGGTLLRDVFDYHAPFGVFGWLGERLFVSAYMRRFLLARLRELKALAESTEWRRFVVSDGS
jgi:ligand-binding SRPBCC domain-containing protein